MAKQTGFGSSLWNDLQKVRVTQGKVEAPVRADGNDGVQIGSFVLPADPPKPAGERKRGLFARLFRRR